MDGWSPGREEGGGDEVVLSEENTHRENEWMPLPSQCLQGQYWDFPLCQTQPEENVMMVSLQPNFPGQLPFLAPDGQLVYPVQSFPIRLGFPENCSYLGPVKLTLDHVVDQQQKHVIY